mgnify:CR=1 FL=1
MMLMEMIGGKKTQTFGHQDHGSNIYLVIFFDQFVIPKKIGRETKNSKYDSK